jgi:hypothetical protein
MGHLEVESVLLIGQTRLRRAYSRT